MAVPHDQVVHVWLEILDNARLVGGNQVRTIVRELECTDGSVMRLRKRKITPGLISAMCGEHMMRTDLKNGLKIECEAIP